MAAEELSPYLSAMRRRIYPSTHQPASYEMTVPNNLFSFLSHPRLSRIFGGLLFCCLPLVVSCLSTGGGNLRQENLPPVIEAITLQVEKSGTEYSINVKAQDPEAQPLA